MNNFLPNLRVCLLLLCLSVLSAWAETYELYTESTITEGEYIIVGYQNTTQYYYAMNHTCTDNQYMGISKVTPNNDAISPSSTNIVWNIVESTDDADSGKGYFYICYTAGGNTYYLDDNATDSKNHVRTNTTRSNTCKWKLTYNSTQSLWEIKNVGNTSTKRTLSFYTGSSRVACYSAVQKGNICHYLYKKLDNDSRTPVNITNFSADEPTLVVGSTTNTSVANDQNDWTAAYAYSSDNEAVATVDANGVITAVAKGTANITASLNIANDDANYKKGATSSKAVSITVNNPSHTAHFSVNGTIDPTNDQLVEEDAVVPFPSDPEANGVVFRGWATAAIDGEQDDAPAMITKATETMGVNDVTYYAVFATATDGETQWQKVSISSSLSTGVYALICPDGYAFNGNISNGQGARTSRTFSFTDNIATSAPDGTLELTLTVIGDNQYTLYNASHGYLFAYAASAGKLAWHKSESSYWSYESNLFKYVIEESFAHMRYYNNLFRTYAPATRSGEEPYLAKKITSTTYSNYCTTFTLNPALSFEANEYWVSAGATIASPTPTTNTDGAITYTVTSGNAATVDTNTGAISLTGKTGDVTITASSAETANYHQGWASYTLHVVAPLSLPISEARYATFAPSQNVELPAAGRDGTIRIYYYAQDSEDDAIAVSSAYDAVGEGGTIARGTGIIVKAEAGSVEFPVNTTVSPIGLVENKLVGVLESTACPGLGAYIFKNGSQGIGFYPWLRGNLAAGKCYLQLPANQAPTFIGLDDEETGILALPKAEESMPQTREIYNLVGQRIRQMQRGMNIVNGKKVLK